MSKIKAIEGALELLKEADASEGVVSELEEELKTLTDRDADVRAFREVLLGDRASEYCASWEDSPENSKDHYRQKFDEFKKFFDELGDSMVLEKGDIPNKNLKYKDTDGDVFYWSAKKNEWRYIKSNGTDYAWMGDGFPGGGYGNLFPMEVVR